MRKGANTFTALYVYACMLQVVDVRMRMCVWVMCCWPGWIESGWLLGVHRPFEGVKSRSLIWSSTWPPRLASPHSTCPLSPASRWVGTAEAESRHWGRSLSWASLWRPPPGRPACGAAWGKRWQWWASGCSPLGSGHTPSLMDRDRHLGLHPNSL